MGARGLGGSSGPRVPAVLARRRMTLVNLWQTCDLSLRDRSLVTIAAPAAMGGDDQLDLVRAPRV